MYQPIDFPSEFLDIGWHGLEQLVNYHQKMANVIEKRAKLLKEREATQKRINARTDDLANSYKIVLQYLEKGYNSVDSAIDAAARDLGCPEFTVLAWWKVWCKKRDTQARARRDQAIIELCRQRLTNREIAKIFGIHENTITRAVNRYLFPGVRPCDRRKYYPRRKTKKGDTK